MEMWREDKDMTLTPVFLQHNIRLKLSGGSDGETYAGSGKESLASQQACSTASEGYTDSASLSMGLYYMLGYVHLSISWIDMRNWIDLHLITSGGDQDRSMFHKDSWFHVKMP